MITNTSVNLTNQIIRLADVKAITGLSRSTIYDRMNSKSRRFDSSFPQKIKLGARAVGWLKGDIDAWLDSMISMSSAEGDKS
jgi:prophage regulatory protein